MAGPRRGPSDERVEQWLGNLLRVGVVLAAAVVLVGAVVFLFRHGREPRDFHIFHGEPAELRSPPGIVRDALTLRGRAIIQLGLLLLVATPVARVVFSALAFARQRDWTYVLLTLVVLAVLLYSLFLGELEG
jgi:uncharacterized membrane protein